MSIERAAMRGNLSEAKELRDRMRLKIEGFASSLRQSLNTAATYPPTLPEDMDIPMMDEQWDGLKAAWAELAKIQGDIARLERELR